MTSPSGPVRRLLSRIRSETGVTVIGVSVPHVVSIHVAQPEVLTVGSRNVTSGIVKRPVEHATVTVEGLAGDHVVNTKHHGGPGQAVYLYSAEDYAWWEAELGQELTPGLFGENLTISTFGSTDPRVGDRYRIGEVELELTSCRIPCDVFSARIGLPNWIRRFRDARRPGAYARVLTEGQLAVRDDMVRTAAPTSNVTVLDTQDLYYGEIEATAETLRRFLDSPVGHRNRADYEAQLDALG